MQTCYSFVFFLVAATNIYITFAAPKQASSEKTCTTQECVDAASKILAKLDRTIDPCDNFYQFACGGFIKNHPINASYPIISSMKLISEKTTERIKDILEDSSKPDDTLALKNARKLYAMCMNEDQLQRIGASGLTRLVRKNGGWPMSMSLKDWRRRGYKNWQSVSDIMMKNVFYNGLYTILVGVDEKKSDSNVIVVGEPNSFVPRDIMIDIGQDPKKKAIYASLIKRTAYILANDRGAYVEEATLDKDANNVADFEIELAKLTLTNEDSRDIDKIYNELTIKELQRVYNAQRPSSNSKINWFNVLRKLFASENIVIMPSEKLVVQAYKFLTSIVPLLERTSSRVIINYMHWTIIRDLLPYGDSRLEKISFELAEQFHSQPPSESRWKICVEKANLNTAISHAYVKKYVEHEHIKDVNNIIMDIANVVRGQISASTWMDEATKKASLDKLTSMRQLVSIPEWYSNKAVDEHYGGLIITSEYLESQVNLFRYEIQRVLRKLRKPVDKTEWIIEPTTVNAYYDPSGNVICITAALLQDAIYDRNRPMFMNYGSTGFVIGHEINHGFDNMGRKFDKDGNSKEWWTSQTTDNYKKLAECFIDQYNSYPVPGLDSDEIRVNGQLTLGENIGDSAGIVAAYFAYKNKKMKLNDPDIRLPGLEEYSNDQIFFMSAAHTFCENLTQEKIRLLVLDEHPRAETRIRGSFSNFPEFSTAYNCPVGKVMNPEKKCTLW